MAVVRQVELWGRHWSSVLTVGWVAVAAVVHVHVVPFRTADVELWNDLLMLAGLGFHR
jgi:hypothetical protein